MEGGISQACLTQITWNKIIYILRKRGHETQILGKVKVRQRTAYDGINEGFLTSNLRLINNLNFNTFFLYSPPKHCSITCISYLSLYECLFKVNCLKSPKDKGEKSLWPNLTRNTVSWVSRELQLLPVHLCLLPTIIVSFAKLCY